MDFNETQWNPFWAATYFSVVGFLIIDGNSLTIATLLTKKKVSQSSTVLVDQFGLCWSLGWMRDYIVYHCIYSLSTALSLLDMFAGLSSIFHFISLERLHSTLRPSRHWQLSVKVVWVAIATPWILSLSSTSMLSKFRPVSSRLFFLTICLITPLLIKSFSCLSYWRKMRKSAVKSFRQNQEARFLLGAYVFLVTVASFIMWMPFLCVHIAARVLPVPRPALFFFHRAPSIQLLVCQLCYLRSQVS